MSAHVDILDRPEPLTVPFWTSLTLHLLVIGGIAGSAVIQHRFQLNLGDKNGGGFGVLVTPVASIPIPNRGGPVNPVANDTPSQMPTPPAVKEKAPPAPKPKPQTATDKMFDLMAKAPQKKPLNQPANKYRDQKTYADNQIYSNLGQQLSSPDFAKQGGGGVGMGNNDPFGEQFGAYANLVRQAIAQNWKPASQARANPVVVTFTIRRDGSVVNPAVAKSSGNQSLDFSALRAVKDAQLLPLPAGFPRSQADVQLTFVVGN